MSELISVAGDSESLRAADERLTELVEVRSAAGEECTEAVSRLIEIKTLRGQFSQAALLQEGIVTTHQQAASSQLKAELEGLCALHRAAGALDDAVDSNTRILTLVEAKEGVEAAALVPVLERQIELLTEAKRKKEARAAKKRLRKLIREHR
jgi:hypothetical protein